MLNKICTDYWTLIIPYLDSLSLSYLSKVLPRVDKLIYKHGCPIAYVYEIATAYKYKVCYSNVKLKVFHTGSFDTLVNKFFSEQCIELIAENIHELTIDGFKKIESLNDYIEKMVNITRLINLSENFNKIPYEIVKNLKKLKRLDMKKNNSLIDEEIELLKERGVKIYIIEPTPHDIYDTDSFEFSSLDSESIEKLILFDDNIE